MAELSDMYAEYKAAKEALKAQQEKVSTLGKAYTEQALIRAGMPIGSIVTYKEWQGTGGTRKQKTLKMIVRSCRWHNSNGKIFAVVGSSVVKNGTVGSASRRFNVPARSDDDAHVLVDVDIPFGAKTYFDIT